ncbi:Heparinase II/III-like protein [Lutibacter oricola]|uniref:Heparinase II/III-like protein n=1 Tax=Lutibacter oricola TaxID=762486 RepID=A0A1H3FRI5_9FLAO|nr:heparinase II/III family protein [Lutibacter oricola]SDX93551.1 Heparinase II/III-like protein [Lutibacter oricola]
MIKYKIVVFCLFLGVVSWGYSQQIPSKKVIDISQLSTYLKKEVQQELSKSEDISNAKLADYFRTKFSERYFFDWHNFEQRFTEYQKLYPTSAAYHKERGLDHTQKFAGKTNWVLPFNYLNGKPVNAYALRHLARQHKTVDLAFDYFNSEKKNGAVAYFTTQMHSLNEALASGTYEKIEDGNGVYEAFRAGYRVLNWLQIHTMFLGEESYTNEQQLETIATLLQHAENLYEVNQNFHAGNHQTRGLSALAMVSILLRDFEGADVWYAHAMKLLEEHLKKEINNDGFQFERSVHYHISDIGNYYYVFQLAQKSNLPVSKFWEEKLASLFTSLTKIAFPDKTAPVLQDDTDTPWAEKNDISGALTLGYLLFNNPTMGYFATTKVSSKMYWFLSKEQLLKLQEVQKEQPTFESVSFPTTGYYIMRNGWQANDQMLLLSAGLDADKPDHQHGDMLGIQAMANGKVVLPNYQVRYSLPDLELFKNSMVKNVALVDSELQGKKYTSNKGGSGFGKFKQLPQPTTNFWKTSKMFDAYSGSHNGFENIGVSYSRQVIYLKNDFWIVKDNFSSKNTHTYKQVWQGHYTAEQTPNLLRASFDNAEGLDIFQLNKIDAIESSGARGKQWTVASKQAVNKFSFVTVLFPYTGYLNRIDELNSSSSIKGWKQESIEGVYLNKNAIVLSKENTLYAFLVEEINTSKGVIKFSEPIDLVLQKEKDVFKAQILGGDTVEFSKKGSVKIKSNGIILRAGSSLKLGDEFVVF